MIDFCELFNNLKDEPQFRVTQVKRAIFKDLASDWSEITVISKLLREELNKTHNLEINAQLFESQNKKSIKALISLDDGNKVESVLIKAKDRNTICVSTQVGCPVGCTFCATGKLGFKRNLSYSEIVNQILLFERLLYKSKEKVTNIVYMGMGEPFLNYDEVIHSVKFLNDRETLNLGIRRFSISTSGIIPGIDKLARSGLDVNLAISFHATTDELRTKLMPINKKYPLAKLLDSIRNYIKITNRKVMIEYLMIKGVNDTDFHAQNLVKMFKDSLVMINLIPYNETGVFMPSDKQQVDHFWRILQQNGVQALARQSYGDDISAACGQLACKNNKNAT